MKFLARAFSSFFGKLFHKRSIIIISERKTNHVSLSGALQFSLIIAIIGCVGWASYSTGSYMAARTVLEQRDETIKSVASSRIDTNFKYTVANMQPQRLGPIASAYTLPLTDPAYTLASVNHEKLFARIALLENKVKELRSANAEIIQTVREKTHGKIVDMEDIIRKTGLNPDVLKQEAARLRRERQQNAGDGDSASQGGPFIPMETPGTDSSDLFGKELSGKLDQLALLSDIVGTLPLGMPIAKAENHSNFGRRVDPFTGRLAFHAGVDLAASPGAEVKASGAGKVISAGWNGAYGNAIDVEHGLGIVTRYGHLSGIKVSVGDIVKKGQTIGVQGSTGRSTGPHLHYEVRYKDKPINPNNFLTAGYNVPKIH